VTVYYVLKYFFYDFHVHGFCNCVRIYRMWINDDDDDDDDVTPVNMMLVMFLNQRMKSAYNALRSNVWASAEWWGAEALVVQHLSEAITASLKNGYKMTTVYQMKWSDNMVRISDWYSTSPLIASGQYMHYGPKRNAVISSDMLNFFQ
jgi:hypothetical protein